MQTCIGNWNFDNRSYFVGLNIYAHTRRCHELHTGFFSVCLSMWHIIGIVSSSVQSIFDQSSYPGPLLDFIYPHTTIYSHDVFNNVVCIITIAIIFIIVHALTEKVAGRHTRTITSSTAFHHRIMSLFI